MLQSFTIVQVTPSEFNQTIKFQTTIPGAMVGAFMSEDKVRHFYQHVNLKASAVLNSVHEFDLDDVKIVSKPFMLGDTLMQLNWIEQKL